LEIYKSRRHFTFAFSSPSPPSFLNTLTMTVDTAENHLKYLFDLLSHQNESNYIGENISQLAHSLQAAHLATLAGCNEETAIAALLHDIGQVLPLDAKKKSSRSIGSEDIIDERGVNVGRVGHEMIGEQYLKSKGWPENVCQLVGAHVVAKR
jgi:predicted HD phosphohydrolase